MDCESLTLRFWLLCAPDESKGRDRPPAELSSCTVRSETPTKDCWGTGEHGSSTREPSLSADWHHTSSEYGLFKLQHACGKQIMGFMFGWWLYLRGKCASNKVLIIPVCTIMASRPSNWRLWVRPVWTAINIFRHGRKTRCTNSEGAYRGVWKYRSKVTPGNGCIKLDSQTHKRMILFYNSVTVLEHDPNFTSHWSP